MPTKWQLYCDHRFCDVGGTWIAAWTVIVDEKLGLLTINLNLIVNF